MAKHIQLTKGYSAIVDDEDFEYLNQFSWHYSDGYAIRRHSWKENGKWYGKNIKMHREIMKAEKGTFIDHKNRDRLDNRKDNLRFASPSQNAYNKNVQTKKKHSIYKGVCKVKSGNNWYWFSYIEKDFKRTYLGNYKTEVEAAKAYDKAAKELHGDYACLNFPTDSLSA